MAGPRRATPAPRPGAAQRAQSAAQRQAEQEAQRRAAEEEARRLAEQEARRVDRASVDNLPEPAAAQDPNNPDAAADPNARPLFAELTDAGTGLPMLVDPTAIAHIGPGVGSVLHEDPAKAAKGEHVMGALTEVSTIGGVVLKVLEDLETVAAVLGV